MLESRFVANTGPDGCEFYSLAKPLPLLAVSSIGQIQVCIERFVTHSRLPYRPCGRQMMISLKRFARWAVIWWTCAEHLWTEWTAVCAAISALLEKRAWRGGFANYAPILLSCLFDRLRVMYDEPERLLDGPVCI